MRSTSFLLALALVACDAKDAGSRPAAEAAPTEPAAAKAAAAPAAHDPAAAADATKAAAAPAADAAAPEAAAAEAAPAPAAAEAAPADAVLVDQTVKLLDGTDKSLADYRGKALLLVNTASECGYTPQYADLQALYAKYKGRGLEVLAFPSNDFGGQEPGTPEQIREFVDSEYAVEFEMFDKVAIKGPDKAPLYRALTEQTPEGIRGEVKWNVTKFLVDPQGRVVQRFESAVEPTDPQMIEAIERVLPKA